MVSYKHLLNVNYHLRAIHLSTHTASVSFLQETRKSHKRNYINHETSHNNNTDCQRSIPSLLSRSLGTVCVRKVYQKHLLTVRSVGLVTFSMSTVWGWALGIDHISALWYSDLLAYQWCSRLAAVIFTQMVRVWFLALNYVHYGKKSYLSVSLFWHL